jgi:hypothetical protein
MNVIVERGKSYGDPAVNLGRIAGMWSAYLGVDVSAHDVGWMMALLKASRSKADPQNVDNYVDAHGYVEIAESLK